MTHGGVAGINRRLRCRHRCPSGAVCGDGLIDGQFCHRPFLIGSFVAFHRRPRELQVRLLQIQLLDGLLKVGLDLIQLLIDLGRFDFRQQLACFHLITDVNVSFAQIAADAGVDDRVLNRLGGSRQRQFGCCRFDGADHVHRRRSVRRLSGGHPQHQERREQGPEDQRNHKNGARSGLPWSGRFRVRICLGRSRRNVGCKGCHDQASCSAVRMWGARRRIRLYITGTKKSV